MKKADFFQQTAAEGARRLVLRLLSDCEAVSARLGTPGDGEALHDLRVCLHRLNCLLRDYREHLPPAAAGLRKKLKKLAAGTNPARDTEAGILLLDRFAAVARREEKTALLAAAGLLKARASRAGKGFAAGLREKLGGLAGKLRACLAAGPVPEESALTLAAVSGKAVRKHIKGLKAGLAEIKKLSDGAEIHRARLLTKKLRYILEPEARFDRRAARSVRKLARLQCLLGGLHDIEVLYGLTGLTAGKAAMTGKFGRAAVFLKEKKAGFFRELSKNWLKGGGSGFFRKLNRCARG